MGTLLAALVTSASAQDAPSVSSSTPSQVAISTPPVSVLISTPAAPAVQISTQGVAFSTAAVSLSTSSVSLSTASVAVSTPTAEAFEKPTPARPWVLGDVTASGLKNVKFSVIRGQVKARRG